MMNMNEIEREILRASYPLMSVDELQEVRAEMSRLCDEQEEDTEMWLVYAEMHDELNAVIDFRYILEHEYGGMTEEEYHTYWASMGIE